MKRSREKDDAVEKLIPPTKRPPHWSKGLLASMEDPSMIVTSDDLTVTITDMYPKARHHYLVLPRKDIPSLKTLNESHVPLLTHMLQVARDFVSRLNEPELEFQYGFHAAASMARLHMHVISRDFDSVHLKTKRHWNSFTSPFFIDAEIIITALKINGRPELMDKAKCDLLLKESLQCHVCREPQPTMPKLKQHIKRHIRK